MPCFKGIAVSVHAEGAPLPEYGLMKQSRVCRVNTYVPVPKPHVPQDGASLKPEPSKFAISITLLTPGLPVPYSTPKATSSDPYPQPQMVGGQLPTHQGARGNYRSSVGAYVPITKSDNETIAAYIYFDGRAKEEVATLLRPGEETWVNSRWVQVPDSEGGGLAEREFLFREVGLERWLNGLDLDGHDAAAKIEKRRQKFDKRRRRMKHEHGSDEDLDIKGSRSPSGGVLKYGGDEMSPVEKLSDGDDFSSDSDDDAPPEAAGQIKVAMFRVLASGEIKKGEYSPQFDAHDDDEEGSKNGMEDDGEDVDHTTSFAKPKTLDPKSISTQTVTGIDGPDKPFAVFTFFYRGERQLQKMGLLPDSKQQKTAPGSNKRRSAQLDFSNLGPLKPGGTVGFSAFRDNDPSTRSNKARKKSNGDSGGAMLEDSDEDEDYEPPMHMDDGDDKDEKDVKTLLSPEDARNTGEIAEGVGRIKLKRQHSADPLNTTTTRRRSPNSMGSTSVGNTPPTAAIDIATKSTLPPSVFGGLPDDDFVGSPMKRQRGSSHEQETGVMPTSLGTGGSAGFGAGSGNAPTGGGIVAAAEAAQMKLPEPEKDDDIDEML